MSKPLEKMYTNLIEQDLFMIRYYLRIMHMLAWCIFIIFGILLGGILACLILVVERLFL